MSKYSNSFTFLCTKFVKNKDSIQGRILIKEIWYSASKFNLLSIAYGIVSH